MRLPWPFGHRTSPDAPASTASGAGRADAPAPPAPTARAWAALPPLQRTAGRAPLVAPSGPFLAGVAGNTPLPPIVGPLGHQASPAAPPGIVVAHARPVPVLASRAELPGRPVQRRGGPVPAAPGAGPVPEAAVDAPHAAAPAAADPAPIRRLAAVSSEATVTPPVRPLTQSAPALVPVGRPIVSRTLADPASQAPSAPTLPVPRRRPGLGAPIGREPAAAQSEPAKTVSRWAEGSAAIDWASADLAGRTPASLVPESAARAAHDHAAVPSPLATRPRRPGLGAPLSVPPASAVAQRGRAAAEPAPGQAAAPADAGAAVRHPAASGAPRALPVLPVARRRRDDTTDDPPAPGPRGPRRTPEATTPVTRPTVGASPLQPSIPVQRSATAASTPPAGAVEGPIAVRWTAPEPLPEVVIALPHQERTGPRTGGAATVQLSPSDDVAARGTASAPAMREITFPAPGTRLDVPVGWAADVQRAVAGPSELTRAGTMPGRPRPAATPGAAGPAPTAWAQDRPLSLARPPVPESPHAAAPATPSGALAPRVGFIVADATGPSAPPTVQMSRPSASATPVATFTATPVVQRDAAPPAPVAAEGRASTDAELDELARKLFGRIRGQLRAEVMHEREAKGLSFDAF